jgi:hypothetical protein
VVNRVVTPVKEAAKSESGVAFCDETKKYDNQL